MNKPTKLLGIQHFGSDGGEHTVSTKVKDTATNLTVANDQEHSLQKKTRTIIIMAFLFLLVIWFAWRQISSIS